MTNDRDIIFIVYPQYFTTFCILKETLYLFIYLSHENVYAKLQ